MLQYILYLKLLFISAAKIDCYVCSSKNGSDNGCDDPFHPQYNSLRVSCRQGMDGRYGLFPARYCIKMKGTSSEFYFLNLFKIFALRGN
jgi:hypothetical protein